MRILGTPIRPSSPADALRHGAALVAQEVAVQGHLSVAENVLFGCMPRTRLGLIEWSGATRLAAEVLTRLDLDVHPEARLGVWPVHIERGGPTEDSGDYGANFGSRPGTGTRECLRATVG